MTRNVFRAMAVALMLSMVGCHYRSPVEFDAGAPSYRPHELAIERPDVCPEHLPSGDILDTQAPATVRKPQKLEQLPLTLEQAVSMALANNEVIRSQFGTVVSAPQGNSSIFDPAIQETSPLNSTQAALSAFDAQFATSIYFARDERTFNNPFFGGGAASLASNTGVSSTEVRKVAPTGTQFALRHVVDYNRNNAGFNLFRSAFNGILQGEFRHPLSYSPDLFRIAGAVPIPGQYNGILVARINTDIQLSQFEAAVRNLLLDVERTYWELYFAYRDLDSKRTARESALGTWKLEAERHKAGTVTLASEALARQQYFLAESAVADATSGFNLGQGRGSNGVFAVEAQLRRLLGLPAHDGKLILPVTDPIMADVQFDWSESLSQAMAKRVELWQQQWAIKQRELELIAARNFARVKVDFFGQYTWRGFGDKLLGNGPPNTSLYQDLLGGNLQGWNFGIEVSTPVGNRIGHLAVRNAELRLARERAVIDTQQKQIVTELKQAFVELARAYTVSRSYYNRYRANDVQLRVLTSRNKIGVDETDLVLDAQQRKSVSESQFHRAVVDYNIALANLHYVRGTLLDHLQVRLNEGPWTADAHNSAVRMAQRLAHKRLNYCIEDSYLISQGERED